ncbi:MAG: type II secretion system protein [Verrucomicrobiaceae bacterium]|nr:type II secretion system protein [Verrucomicrobiaceae bacterium]
MTFIYPPRKSNKRAFTIIESLMMLLAIVVFSFVAYAMLKRDGKIPGQEPVAEPSSVIVPEPAPKSEKPKSPSVEPPKMPLILPKGEIKGGESKSKPAGS